MSKTHIHDIADEDKDCAHCAINRAIDVFAEAHSPVMIEQLIDDLSACMCELIASQPDAQVRKALVKQIAANIPKRVRLFREEGRYPGGHENADGAGFVKMH